MDRAEKGLASTLQANFGGEVHHGNIKWNVNPLQVHLTVNDVVAKVVDAKSQKTYELQIGTAEIFKSLLQDQKLQVKLPQSQELAIINEDGSERRFDVLFSGAGITFYPSLDEGEAVFSAQAVTLQEQGDSKPMVRAGDMYIVLSGMKGGESQIRFSLNRANLHNIFGGKDFSYDAILADYRAHNFDRFFISHLAPAIVSKNQAEFNQALESMAYVAAKNNSFVELTDFRLGKKDADFTLHGRIAVDKNVRPSVDLSVSSNDMQTLLSGLEEKNIINYSVIDKSPVLGRIINRAVKQKQGVINITALGGSVRINGLLAGDAPSVPEILGR